MTYNIIIIYGYEVDDDDDDDDDGDCEDDNGDNDVDDDDGNNVTMFERVMGSVLCWAQFYPCSDSYHSSASKNISVHMSDDIQPILQAVSNATIVSVTADPEWVWLPTREPV